MKNNLPERTWFPQPHQLVIGPMKDSPYVHSLFVGFTAPLLNLPVMIWRNVLYPMSCGLFFIVQFMFFSALAGLRGRAHGFLVDMPTMTITIIEEEQKK